jgi:TolB protein
MFCIAKSPTRILTVMILLMLQGTLCGAQTDDSFLKTKVTKGGISRIKIAIPSATGSSGAGDISREIVEAVREDLDFSGYFEIVDPRLYSLVPAVDVENVPYDDWLAIGADSLLHLEIGHRGNTIDLSAWLFENGSKSLLFAKRYGGSDDLVRRIAHQLSDDLVRERTGQRGIAMTRIAFVSDYEDGKEIYLMDYDGRRIRRLTTTHTINLLPVWAPSGNELAFMSWRGKQPAVYLMSPQGKLSNIATVGGELTATPGWSADGQRLVYSADVDGNSEIYILDRTTGRNTRVTRNTAIDTAPSFSPNGREITFTSDRSGSPQIYIMDAEGLNVRRVSWASNYNDSSAWSPLADGLIYVSRVDGRFDIMSLDLASGKETRLTHGEGNNENPSWSPDGRHVVFSSNRRGSYDIHTMRSDGTDVRRLTRRGNCFTPDWSR